MISGNLRDRLANVYANPFWLMTIPLAVCGWVIALVGSIVNSSVENRQFPTFSWWGLAFQALVMLLAMYAIVANRIYMYKNTILAFLAIATVYSTNSTNNFIWRNSTSAGAAAAGQILLSVLNILWMLYFGTTHDEPLHAFINSCASSTNVGGIRSRSEPLLRASHLQNKNKGSQGVELADNSSLVPKLYRSEQLRGFEEIDANDNQLMRRSGISMASLGTNQAEPLMNPTEYKYRAQALYSYEANPEDTLEISFEKGEILEISDISGRWWQACKSTGQVGICPSNYMKLL